MAEDRIMGFKKFSDMNVNKEKDSKIEDLDSSINIDINDSIPMNPNLPLRKTKKEKTITRNGLIPKDQSLLPCDDNSDIVDRGNSDQPSDVNIEDFKIEESKVNLNGKVARFPKNTKAHKAYNFLENVKISKKKIWYIMVEKDNEIQMVKFNRNEGVDLNKFVSDLKDYYINKNSDNKAICEAISKMNVDGSDEYSMIKNIPLVEVNGKKMITKITEDLINLLSK